MKSNPIARHQLLTIYGRKPVLEALKDSKLHAERLHCARSNRRSSIIDDILSLAHHRGVGVKEHSRQHLARISRNGRQDQGIALDIRCPEFTDITALGAVGPQDDRRLLALDQITNPQNAGMIVRSATAAGIDGILWPRRGVAALGPLVIKASAGTLFRAPIIHCEDLASAICQLRDQQWEIATLSADAATSIFEHRQRHATVYVLGGESEGVSESTRRLSTQQFGIPMARGVESLNVAVTAGIVAFATAPANRR